MSTSFRGKYKIWIRVCERDCPTIPKKKVQDNTNDTEDIKRPLS